MVTPGIIFGTCIVLVVGTFCTDMFVSSIGKVIAMKEEIRQKAWAAVEIEKTKIYLSTPPFEEGACDNCGSAGVCEKCNSSTDTE